MTTKTKTTSSLVVSRQQAATLLAAIRYYQSQGFGDPDRRPPDVHEIATDGGQCISLDDDGLDHLAEVIRTSPHATLIRTPAPKMFDKEIDPDDWRWRWPEGEQPDEGEAACPFCHAIWLDGDEAKVCCPEKRAGYEEPEPEPEPLPSTRKALISAIKSESKAKGISRMELNSTYVYPTRPGAAPQLHSLKKSELEEILTRIRSESSHEPS